MEALELLDQLVDESDPDVDFPNSFHAYQTAEGIRRAHPDKGRAGPGGDEPWGCRRGSHRRPRSPPDWFHLVGLLHDLGKVLALFGEPQVSGVTGGGAAPGAAMGPPRTLVAAPQWAVVGDTFPVGCKVQSSVVFSDSTFHQNPDSRDPRYR